MKMIRSLLIALALVTTSSHAAFLSLTPSVSFAETGDTVVLDLMIGGLGDGGPDSLGDFDLDILYDPAVVSISSYSLTNMLGDIDFFEAFDFSLGDDGLGTLGLSVVSFLTDSELNALQPDSFSLATISFSVDFLPENSFTWVEIGTIYGMGDVFGDPLEITSTANALITNSINEPAAFWLMLLPALLLLKRRRS
ncbi:hypothetical protein [Lacimicrobium alkaliphilum]|uniref:Cohesin domain-containing protein n=1 Tax=Lacimicrobium alkaliphilum TaxID=1526571 RepID=A0A0U2QL70_9ALTE|nr:hypothetical protein [Lacimicrobium alkaliphilum]ALS98059.1 hypothetical protein AT746_07145 [Lacimicrobium alkaliphilum]